MADSNTVRILFVADVVGQPGVEVVSRLLPPFLKKQSVDYTILNGENANNNGKGITLKIARRLIGLGVDLITGGNHTWESWHNEELFREEKKVIRPANYPEGNFGKGEYVAELASGQKIATLNLQGRTFLYPIHCPFRYAEAALPRLREEAQIVIVDFHAEATAEKIALGWYVDGKASAMIGTHTHVQTADERILPNGTAYITDAGMTGSHDSVIGMKIDSATHRFLYQTPKPFVVATGNLRLSGVLLDIDSETGRAVHIERVQIP